MRCAAGCSTNGRRSVRAAAWAVRSRSCCCVCCVLSVVLLCRAAVCSRLCCCVCHVQSVGRCVLLPVRCAVGRAAASAACSRSCCCLQWVVLLRAVGRAAACSRSCSCVCHVQSVGRCVRAAPCAVCSPCVLLSGCVRSVPSCRCVGRVRSVSAARTETVGYVIFGRLYPGGGKQWSAQNPTMLWRCAACAVGRCVLPPVQCAVGVLLRAKSRAVGCADASATCSR